MQQQWRQLLQEAGIASDPSLIEQGYFTCNWQGGYIRSAQRFEELPRHSPAMLEALARSPPVAAIGGRQRLHPGAARGPTAPA